MYTLKEIYAALAAVEHGPEMLEDLQTELGKLRSESAARRTEKQNILKTLGIEDESGVTSIAEALAAMKKTGSKPDEIAKQIEALTTQITSLTEKATASEQTAAAEKEKRIAAIKANKALAALQGGNAANPEVISKLILDQIKVKDDDSIVFTGPDGKELSVDDGVKSFLTANPWAVKNTQNPGGNSGGGDPGTHRYTKAEIEKMTPDQINANWKDVQESLKTV